MMRTIKKHDDGIEWLRNLRQGIAARCGHDLARQSALYRQAAAQHSYKACEGEAAAVGAKRDCPVPPDEAQKVVKAVGK
jgi:hypothetical protein